jgi:Plasmid pRiA4b ORF-3-like protein
MAPADASAIASAAPGVRRVRVFVDWVGAGRALTQTGRIRRADALALVGLLDTGDIQDPRYPIQSSSELHWLNLWVEWAKACRLVRVVHGRIVPVSKNAKLLEQAPALVARMLDALPRLGDAFGDSVVTADAAHTVEAVLSGLVGHGGSLSVERACEIAWNTATSRYWFPNATEQQIGRERKRSDGDLRRTLHAVSELGVLTVTDGMIALTAFGKQCLNAWLGLGTPASHALRVRVTLEGSADPVIWRLVRVPADIRLDRFHQLLGAAIGWQDSHLHVFERGSERYGHPDAELEIRDERAMTLGRVLVDEGDRLAYEYDFGDRWSHEIVLEAIEPGDPVDAGLRCLGGAGRCPPEDVGGIPGYQRLRSVIADPHDSEHSEMLEWLGLEDARQFDAAAFDLDRANEAMAGVLSARVR